MVTTSLMVYCNFYSIYIAGKYFCANSSFGLRHALVSTGNMYFITKFSLMSIYHQAGCDHSFALLIFFYIL